MVSCEVELLAPVSACELSSQSGRASLYPEAQQSSRLTNTRPVTAARAQPLVLLSATAYHSPPIDCFDVYRARSGCSSMLSIYPAGPTSLVQVYCDMSSDGVESSAEKWTVISISCRVHEECLTVMATWSSCSGAYKFTKSLPRYFAFDNDKSTT